MKPTTEQVRQWVREAGAVELPSSYGRTNFIAMTKNDLEKFAALAYAAGAAAMKERAAKVCEAEESRILSRQSGRDYDPVDTNLRMIACVLPDIAAAIRAQEDADE